MYNIQHYFKSRLVAPELIVIVVKKKKEKKIRLQVYRAHCCVNVLE